MSIYDILAFEVTDYLRYMSHLLAGVETIELNYWAIEFLIKLFFELFHKIFADWSVNYRTELLHCSTTVLLYFKKFMFNISSFLINSCEFLLQETKLNNLMLIGSEIKVHFDWQVNTVWNYYSPSVVSLCTHPATQN